MKVFLASLAFLCFSVLPGISREGAAVKRYTAPGGHWSLELPSSWLARPAQEKGALLSLDVTVRDGKRAGYGRISLFPLDHLYRPEAQPFAEKAVQLSRYEGQDARIGLAPFPHLAFRYARGGRSFSVLMVFRLVRGRGVSFSAVFDRAVAPGIRTSLFAAAGGIETDLSAPSRIPEGWTVKRKGGLLYGIHPDYGGNPGAFHLFLAREEKAFVKVHGVFPPNPDRPPVVLLCPPGEEPSPPPGGPAVGFDARNTRLVAEGLPPKRSLERALLARELCRFFYTLRYGELLPPWLSVGEGEIALERVRTDRALPWVSRDRLDALPKMVPPFHRVAEGGMERQDPSAFANLAFLYCAVFHQGSKKARNAFRACLKTFHETGDWDRAVEEHLFALDAAALQEEAARMARKGLRLVR